VNVGASPPSTGAHDPEGRVKERGAGGVPGYLSGAPGPAGDADSAVSAPGAETCPLCGAPLHREQEWCLRCGAAARTRLATSPTWKAPIITLAVVAALSLGVLAAALVELAGNSGSKATSAIITVTSPAAVTPTPTTTAPASSAPATTPIGPSTAPATTTPGSTTPGASTPGGPTGATGLTTGRTGTSTSPASGTTGTGTSGTKSSGSAAAEQRLRELLNRLRK
jgi:hypothetical protein